MLRWLLDLFWTDSLWLPANIKWQDMANDPSKAVVYPECGDFLYQIPTTLVLLVLKYVLQKYCFAPLGRSLGVKGKRSSKVHVTLECQAKQLEEAYQTMQRNKDMAAVAKQLQLSERQVARWWRDRYRRDKPSPLDKFCEHAWKTTYLLSGAVFGLYVLWDKEWLRDFDYMYIGYPHHGVTSDIWWYHMVTSSYCWCLLITHFKEPAGHRSDAMVMFVHHVIELAMLYIGWLTCIQRLMTILLPLTNVSEMMLEATKTLKRAKLETAAILMFVAAAAVWFITRMYILPVHFIYSVIFRGPKYVTNMPLMGYVLYAMIYILQIQQIYWSWLILQVLYNFIAHGVTKDVRSSCSEESDANVQASKCDRQNGINGKTAVGFKLE